MKNFSLILLTIFFFCKSTDVVSILLAKHKTTAVCNADNCDNEKTEGEKPADDDQELAYNYILINRNTTTVILKAVFSYTVTYLNKIFNNLFSPPPELA